MRYLTGSLLLTLLAAACKTTAPVAPSAPAQPVILSLGNKKAFTTDDFFQSFTKNQLSADSTGRTDIRQYFDLYTNLKLKVLAAEDAGLDTTEAFREEMNTYRNQLAQLYLTDKVLVESLAAEAYQRMQQEVSASHILVAVSDDAPPADTLAAYRQALALRQRALAGDDFAGLARAHSQDAQTAATGGSIGYFTVFSVVYPFETAAYTTPVGGISQPVRTRFGYHLIRVNDRRPSRGKVRVAHILVRISPAADEAGQQASRQRIDAAYARLQRGEAFETVCREVSDDMTSRANGGLLPFFETGRQVPAFEEAAYALQKPGDLSQPIRTNYGWHILKLIERKGPEPYADLAPSLRQRVTTDTRAEVLRQATVQRLRTEYAVREDRAMLDRTLALADSSLLRGRWRFAEPLDPALQNRTLVTIADRPCTTNQFLAYVRQRQQPQRRPGEPRPAATQPVTGSPAVAMRRLYDRYVGDQLLATEEANLDKKYPEFRALLGEIRDGVLLSQEMEQHVWERSMADSVGQRQYFEQHRANYQYPERAVATVLTAPTDDVLKQVRDRLSGRPPYALRRAGPELSFDHRQTTLSPKIREVLFDVVVTMASNPDYIVDVGGSHEATESDTVSAGRIRAVVAYLRQKNVALNRIRETDYQGARPGRTNAASQRTVTFQYVSNAKADVVRAMKGTVNPPNDASAVTITDGTFAPGANPDLDRTKPWRVGTTTYRRDNRSVAVIIDRIEPARPKTFAEARGAVINDYQAVLEQQWLASLRAKYPVQVNEDELRRLPK